MKLSIFPFSVASTTLLLSLASANACWSSTLLGDTVSYSLTQGVVITSSSTTVGANAEISLYSSLTVDLNAGPLGDLFVFNSAGTLFSFRGIGPDPVVWTFTDLNFSDGASLIGFEIISDLILSPITTTFSGNSLSLSYAPQDHVVGDMIVGRYITATPVPIPAAGYLLLASLGLLTMAQRRKKSA